MSGSLCMAALSQARAAGKALQKDRLRFELVSISLTPLWQAIPKPAAYKNIMLPSRPAFRYSIVTTMRVSSGGLPCLHPLHLGSLTTRICNQSSGSRSQKQSISEKITRTPRSSAIMIGCVFRTRNQRSRSHPAGRQTRTTATPSRSTSRRRAPASYPWPSSRRRTAASRRR